MPLIRLRARAKLTEFRTTDLRFSRKEATAFLEAALKQTLPLSLLTRLEEQTEGWITGLRLVALAIQSDRDLQTLLTGGDLGRGYIGDYLLSEVFARQPEALRSFLLETSILEHLNASLCEAVTGLSDPICGGQAYLEWFENTSLFTIALDPRNQWFRYHHLFQNLLQHQLQIERSPEEIAALHLSASDWYDANGLVEEAIQHALRAGADAVAATLIGRNVQKILNREHWVRLERWLHALPETLIAGRRSCWPGPGYGNGD